MKPGVYDIPASQYHADNFGIGPSLSSGIAKLLVDNSPLHAWHAHPRLNRNWQPDDDRKFDMGKAVHAAVLGTPALARIDADDYRTKLAQEQRESALARGSIPVLAHKMTEIAAIKYAITGQLRDHEARDAMTAGKPEQVIVWREDESWCRCRLDWLPNKGNIFYDLKSTAQSAHPQDWVRALYNQGADLQSAFYRRGIKSVLGIADPIFRFVVVEIEPPYALTVLQLSPSALDLADRKVEYAIATWAKCLRENTWPGYGNRVFHVDAPAWKAMQFEERAVAREIAADEALTILGAG